MFTGPEENEIRQLNARLTGSVKIRRVDSTHPGSPKFKQFCNQLSQLAPRIKISVERDADPQPPQILIGEGLRFQAVPTGRELSPFLEAVAALDSGSFGLDEATQSRLKHDRLPAFLKVFIASECPFCPTAVRRLTPLSLADDKIQLLIIDGSLFPEEAQSQNIKAVPTIILEEQFRWTGSVPVQEIIDAINSRDPATLGALSLESILQEGQAGRLADMMLEAGRIFPAFYDLLIHPKWPIRLGAMVVMEDIAARNRAMAEEAATFLMDGFYRQPGQVRGDILYLFGEIGSRRTAPWIKEVLAEEDNDEVREAAMEALEKMPKE